MCDREETLGIYPFGNSLTFRPALDRGIRLFSDTSCLFPAFLPPSLSRPPLGAFFTRIICINIHRALNRLNEYTGWRKADVTSPAGFSAVNFNRKNMLTLPSAPPPALSLYAAPTRARAWPGQDNPPKRTNSFRSASSERSRDHST